MPRRKQYLSPKLKKTDTAFITYPETRILESADYFYFSQLYSHPKRTAIMNIIRKHMIESNWDNSDYDFLQETYGLDDKERIQRTLNVTPEKFIINILCDYFEITEKVTFRDIIANYDFEQKQIAHKKGRITNAVRKEFLEEFEKSWSDETISHYEYEIARYKDSLYDYDTDEWIDELDDQKEKKIFLKLRRIYAEYPDYVEAFCSSFIG